MLANSNEKRNLKSDVASACTMFQKIPKYDTLLVNFVSYGTILYSIAQYKQSIKIVAVGNRLFFLLYSLCLLLPTGSVYPLCSVLHRNPDNVPRAKTEVVSMNFFLRLLYTIVTTSAKECAFQNLNLVHSVFPLLQEISYIDACAEKNTLRERFFIILLYYFSDSNDDKQNKLH